MQDVTISASRAIAYLLWVLGIACVTASFFWMHELAHAGVLLAMAGAVSQVRGYICALSAREREAFEIGRDSVRPLR